jgi:hypothetical protein
MSETPAPCCYTLCPDPNATHIQTYIGMALNARTRRQQHVKDNVNRYVAAAAEGE